eukprot:gene7880-5506_t
MAVPPSAAPSRPPPSGGDQSSATTSSTPNAALLSARQRLRHQRELDERRRFGLAPLQVDAEASRLLNTTVEISPNVPESMARAPWFYAVSGPTLTHQRLDPVLKEELNPTLLRQKEDKIIDLGKSKTYVPGACQNCGSRTHKTRECYHPKRKVPAKYSGQVTGRDIRVEAAQGRTYAEKRDRYVGEVGTSLSTAHLTAAQAAPPPPPPHEEEEEGKKAKKLKPDLFAAATAQHGGVEIKAVPKYLQNLDAMERGEVFFDPRTGSLRGDPNGKQQQQQTTTDGNGVIRTYEGDVALYRTGDYHTYVEQLHRILTGTSTTFVDFEFDAAVGLLKNIREKLLRAAEEEAEEGGSTAAPSGSDAERETGEEDAPRFKPETLQSAARALGIPYPLPPAYAQELAARQEAAERRRQLKEVEQEGFGTTTTTPPPFSMETGGRSAVVPSSSTEASAAEGTAPRRDLQEIVVERLYGPSTTTTTTATDEKQTRRSREGPSSVANSVAGAGHQAEDTHLLGTTGAEISTAPAGEGGVPTPFASAQRRYLLATVHQRRGHDPHETAEQEGEREPSTALQPTGSHQDAHPPHAFAFGSYFDLETFRWGYKCCRQVRKDVSCRPRMEAKTEWYTHRCLLPTGRLGEEDENNNNPASKNQATKTRIRMMNLELGS